MTPPEAVYKSLFGALLFFIVADDELDAPCCSFFSERSSVGMLTRLDEDDEGEDADAKNSLAMPIQAPE
jgi:hypothetical protein